MAFFVALAALAFVKAASRFCFTSAAAAFFGAVFVVAVFFARADFSFCFAAWNAAHLFFVASEIAFLPAALIFRRLRFGGSGVAAVGLAPP